MQIIILSHIPRTGSTFLIKELNNYAEIVSLTENNAINKLLLYSKDNIKNRLNKFFLYCEQNTNWEFTGEDKKQLYIETDINEIFLKILVIQKKHTKDNSSIIIYKNSGILSFLSKIPNNIIEKYNVKIIKLVRDLRAIYWSNIKTSFTNSNFNKNPLIPINTSNDFINKHKIIDVKYRIYSLKYENLISNKDKEISNILKFISDKINFTFAEEDFYLRLKNTDKVLHKNITKPPQINIIDGWKNKIDKTEIAIIENKGKEYLVMYNYNNSDSICKGICVFIKPIKYLIYKLRIFFKIDKY